MSTIGSNWKYRCKAVLISIRPVAWVVAWLTRTSPRIFMFHRFCAFPHGPTDRVDGKTFEWILSTLSRGWRVITLRDYLRSPSGAASTQHYVVVITVDDGYADFYTIALPRLTAYGMRATIFPVISFLDGKSLWWDRLRRILQSTQVSYATGEMLGEELVLNLSSPLERSMTYSKLNAALLSLDNENRSRVLARLSQLLKVETMEIPGPDEQPLTWTQIQEIHTLGHEVGSHTYSHPNLTQLSREDLSEDVRASKERLEAFLGTQVLSLAYPNGRLCDVNQSVMEEIRSAGYARAVLAYLVPNGAQDPLFLPRMAVTRDRVDLLWKLYGFEVLSLSIREYLATLAKRVSTLLSIRGRNPLRVPPGTILTRSSPPSEKLRGP